MMLGSVTVRDELVRRLAQMLDPHEPLALKLERALDHEHAIVPLTLDDRARIIGLLDDPPVGLGELRGVLMVELERDWREGA